MCGIWEPRWRDMCTPIGIRQHRVRSQSICMLDRIDRGPEFQRVGVTMLTPVRGRHVRRL
eukprot:5225916-Prymnesium_polylepis.2